MSYAERSSEWSDCLTAFSLLVILCFGFLLRFYRLEVPSMWFDEIFVAMTSKYPIRYIIDWTSSVEVHAPYFHMLVKLMSGIGKSDAVLRFIPASCGVLSVYALYVFARENFNSAVALASSALFAVNPVHVLMSRQLRPYSLVVLLSILSMLYLFRYVKIAKIKYLIVVVLCNMASVAVHYTSFFVIFSQASFLCLYFVFSKRRDWKKLLLFFAGMVVSVLPVVYFFIKTIFSINIGILNSDKTYLHCLLTALNRYSELLFLYDVTDIFFRSEIYVSLGLLLVSAVLMFRGDRLFFLYSLCIFVFPIAALTLGKNNFLASRYLMFILPCYCVLLGHFCCKIPGLKTAIPVLSIMYVAMVSFGLFTHQYEYLFARDAYHYYGPAGYSKSIAKDLTALVRENELTYFPDPSLAHTRNDVKNAVNWYYSQYVNTNLLTQQRSENADKLLLNIVKEGALEPDPHYADYLGTPQSTLPLSGNYYLSKYAYKRNASIEIREVPFHLDLNRSLKLLADSKRIENMMPSSLYKSSLVATENNVDASAVYLFVNGLAGLGPYTVQVDAYYTMANKESRYNCNLDFFGDTSSRKYAYEAKPYGKNPNRLLRFIATRSQPFKTLEIENVFNVSFDKPLYAGDNLENVQFNRLVVRLTKASAEAKDAASFYDFDSFDFLRENYYKDIKISGLSEIEYDKARDVHFRWTEGPVATMEYEAKTPRPALFHYIFSQVYKNNVVEVLINGELVKQYENQGAEEDLAYLEKQGTNTIEIRMHKYNRQSAASTFAANDPRQLGIYFEECTLNRNIAAKRY